MSAISQPGDSVRQVLVRFNADGTPDAGFGTNGAVVLPSSAFTGDPACDAWTEAVALRPDGRILTAGWINCFPFDERDGTTLVQYLADGSLDPGFGNGGIVAPAAKEPSGLDLVIDAAGRAVAAWDDLRAVRRDADGFLDTTFGVGGATVQEPPVPSFTSSMALQADGKLIVAGTTNLGGSDDPDFSLVRREAACPTLPDGDGDGVGDACDRCTGGGTLDRARVQLTNRTTPVGDDGMGVKGKFVVADPGAIDPVADGVRVSLYDALDRGVLEVLVPGGLFAPETNAGWSVKVKGAKTVFKYRNKGNRIPRPHGVSNLTVLVGADGLVDFKLKAKNGDLPTDPARPPAGVAIILDPPRATTGLCGELEFDGVAGSCSFSASGRRLLCR